jgi:hypothetical protein
MPLAAKENEDMRKFLCALAILTATTTAYADCTVTVSWTVSADPLAAIQELRYFNGSGEVVKSSGDMTLNHAEFNIPAPLTGDYLFIRTKNAAGTEMADSVHVEVGGMTGASDVTAVTVCR